MEQQQPVRQGQEVEEGDLVVLLLLPRGVPVIRQELVARQEQVTLQELAIHQEVEWELHRERL